VYVVGTNRLFYTPAGFRQNLTVTGTLIDSGLRVLKDDVRFIEDNAGLYYCDVVIPRYGTFMVRCFENGVQTLVQTIVVDPPVSGIVIMKR
jgi:hypothetical protein